MTPKDSDRNTTRDGVLGADAPEVITTDQATGRGLARYPVAGNKEALAVVSAARSAAWRRWELGFEGRARNLRAWRREVARGGEEVAVLIRAENGKPI
jgi:succinate-semialdehyde dehydrogenase / glutarate-semialdehyde dehydrogenase